MVFSLGISFTISFQIEVPPMPESNMPMGLSFIRIKVKKIPQQRDFLTINYCYYLRPNFAFTAGNKSVPLATIKVEASST